MEISSVGDHVFSNGETVICIRNSLAGNPESAGYIFYFHRLTKRHVRAAACLSYAGTIIPDKT